MLLKSVFFDSTHEYIAKLENEVFIMGYSDGTAIGTDGNRYRHVVELDDDENIIKDGWVIIE